MCCEAPLRLCVKHIQFVSKFKLGPFGDVKKVSKVTVPKKVKGGPFVSSVLYITLKGKTV